MFLLEEGQEYALLAEVSPLDSLQLQLVKPSTDASTLI